LSLALRTLIVQFSGRISGRNDNECGASGVKEIDGTLLWTIDPPADRLYAVEPVGVAIINLYYDFLKINNLPITNTGCEVAIINDYFNLNRIGRGPSV
jgi:hypothetical protein